MKQIRVAVGYSNVPIYGRDYNQGQTVNLSNQQYENLPDFVKTQTVVVSSTPDQDTSSLPEPDTTYSDQWINIELIKQGVPMFIIWNGTSYQPDRLVTRTDRPKTFIGPSDPKNIPGVLLAVRDQWINY